MKSKKNDVLTEKVQNTRESSRMVLEAAREALEAYEALSRYESKQSGNVKEEGPRSFWYGIVEKEIKPRSFWYE